MGNSTTRQNVYNSLTGLLSENCFVDKDIIALNNKKADRMKLSSTVRYIKCSSCGGVVINDELTDKKVYEIASQLALAIDKNSVVEVKRIKCEYGDTKEFAAAKDFLNKHCKQVWDVFENKNVEMKIPKEAMKALGITNKPSLESLLHDSIQFFEKDDGSITTNLISLILDNKNLDYSFDEIFEYLKLKHNKEKCNYNFTTVKYMAQKLDYDMEKVALLCADIDLLKGIFDSLPIKEKIKYILKNFSYII